MTSRADMNDKWASYAGPGGWNGIYLTFCLIIIFICANDKFITLYFNIILTMVNSQVLTMKYNTIKPYNQIYLALSEEVGWMVW